MRMIIEERIVSHSRSDKAQLQVQVHVAALNGELKMRDKPIPRRFSRKENAVNG